MRVREREREREREGGRLMRLGWRETASYIPDSQNYIATAVNAVDKKVHRLTIFRFVGGWRAEQRAASLVGLSDAGKGPRRPPSYIYNATTASQ